MRALRTYHQAASRRAVRRKLPSYLSAWDLRPHRWFELAVRPTPLAHVEAMTRFARAFGAARAGKPADATADIAKPMR